MGDSGRSVLARAIRRALPHGSRQLQENIASRSAGSGSPSQGRPTRRGKATGSTGKGGCSNGRQSSCLEISGPRGECTPFPGQGGKSGADRGAAQNNDHPDSGGKARAVGAENFAQAAPGAVALVGRSGAACGDHPEACCFGGRTLPGAKNHEFAVLRRSLLTHQGELGAAGEACRLGQFERSHQAARVEEATGQAPVCRA